MCVFWASRIIRLAGRSFGLLTDIFSTGILCRKNANVSVKNGLFTSMSFPLAEPKMERERTGGVTHAVATQRLVFYRLIDVRSAMQNVYFFTITGAVVSVPYT